MTRHYSISRYNDVWMDNGVENLYRLMSSIEGCNVRLDREALDLNVDDEGAFLRGLESKILDKMDIAIFFEHEDKKTKAKKFIKKAHIIPQYGSSKIKGRNILKEKLYSDTESRLKEIFSDDRRQLKRICVVCGQPFGKKIDKLKQSVYPFVTKIKSLTGVRSRVDRGRSEYHDVCPLCYLVGAAEWLDEAAIYRNPAGRQAMHSTILLPYMEDLALLNGFKSSYSYEQEMLNSLNPTSNLQTSKGVGLSGSYSTLLCFYEKFFNLIWFKYEPSPDISSLGERKEICRTWVCLRIPSGIIKNVKCEQVDVSGKLLTTIYNLVSEKEVKLPYSGFVAKVFFKSDRKQSWNVQNEMSQETREKISASIIRNDFCGFASSLVPRKGGHLIFPGEAIKVLDSLIWEWKGGDMGLTQEELGILKSVGKTVGIIAKNHISILYRLDRTRNASEFLDVLREIGKRLIALDEKDRKKVYPQPLSALIDMIEQSSEDRLRFEDIKNILVTYSCVELSILSFKNGGK